MKKLVSLAILVALTFIASASIVPLKTAQKAAVNAFAEKYTSLFPDDINQIYISNAVIIGQPENPLIYVFDIGDGKGFVLIAADDASIPVLGYSFNGSFNQQEMPSSLENWIWNYTTQIEEIRGLDLPPDANSTAQWNHYSAADFTPVKDISAVAPLLTTNWDQGCYYNALCPVASGGDCNRAWAGCVATAMAMVMKYHNYPAQGTGSHSYTLPPYGTLSANFGNTSYNWAAMPNALYSNNNAVSTLLYHCGISVNMNYSASGSGAYTQDVRNSLVNYFNYSSAAQYVQRFWYTTSGWDNLIKANLDNGKPVVYSGQDPSFGHAFVCDGYQGNNYFHFNWGWSGWNNGYFYCDNLNTANGNFTNAQAAVVNISPSSGPLANFSASSTDFCSETTILFIDNSTGSPTTWNWQFPGGNPSVSNQQNPYVTYINPGTYNVTLTVGNGTDSHTVTKNSYIKVKTKPYGLFPQDTTICCNHSITLDAGNSGAAYAWSTGAFSQTTQVDSSGVGIGNKWIYVDILTSEGCWNRDSIHIAFASCYGIEENKTHTFTIFPNPAKGTISFHPALIGKGEATLKVYTSQGQLFWEEKLAENSETLQLDLSRLPKGIYLLKLETAKEKRESKLVLY